MNGGRHESTDLHPERVQDVFHWSADPAEGVSEAGEIVCDCDMAVVKTLGSCSSVVMIYVCTLCCYPN